MPRGLCPGCVGPPARPCRFSVADPGQQALRTDGKSTCLFCSPERLAAAFENAKSYPRLSQALRAFETDPDVLEEALGLLTAEQKRRAQTWLSRPSRVYCAGTDAERCMFGILGKRVMSNNKKTEGEWRCMFCNPQLLASMAREPREIGRLQKRLNILAEQAATAEEAQRARCSEIHAAAIARIPEEVKAALQRLFDQQRDAREEKTRQRSRWQTPRLASATRGSSSTARSTATGSAHPLSQPAQHDETRKAKRLSTSVPVQQQADPENKYCVTLATALEKATESMQPDSLEEFLSWKRAYCHFDEVVAKHAVEVANGAYITRLNGFLKKNMHRGGLTIQSCSLNQDELGAMMNSMLQKLPSVCFDAPDDQPGLPDQVFDFALQRYEKYKFCGTTAFCTAEGYLLLGGALSFGGVAINSVPGASMEIKFANYMNYAFEEVSGLEGYWVKKFESIGDVIMLPAGCFFTVAADEALVLRWGQGCLEEKEQTAVKALVDELLSAWPSIANDVFSQWRAWLDAPAVVQPALASSSSSVACSTQPTRPSRMMKRAR